MPVEVEGEVGVPLAKILAQLGSPVGGTIMFTGRQLGSPTKAHEMLVEVGGAVKVPFANILAQLGSPIGGTIMLTGRQPGQPHKGERIASRS